MDSEKPLVVGIAGSIRNRAGLEPVDGVDKDVESNTLLDQIQELEQRDIYHENFLDVIRSEIQDLSLSRMNE
jgi:hypothetical protein